MKNLNFLLTVAFLFPLILFLGSCGEEKSDNSSSDTAKITVNKSDTNGSDANESDASESAVNESDVNIEPRIQEIKEKYKEIEDNLSSYTKVNGKYTNPDVEKYWDVSEYTSYKKDGVIMKLVEITGEEGYLSTTNYYFNEGKIMFLFIQRTYSEILYQEERIYFSKEGKVIRALDKSKEAEDESIKLATVENKDNPSFLKNPDDFTTSLINNLNENISRSKEAK